MESGPVISLTEADLQLAEQLAQQTFDRWKSVGGHYNNTLNSHYRGKVGEIAVHRWIEHSGLTVEPIYPHLSRGGDCDLIVNGRRIEVKTWAEKWWREMGRCFATGQMKSLERKADLAVIGYTTDETRDSSTVCLAGWVTVDSIKAAPVRLTGPEWGRKVENRQLEESDLRSMDELVSVLQG